MLRKAVACKRDDIDDFGYWAKPTEWIGRLQQPGRCRIKDGEVEGRPDRRKGEETQMLPSADVLKHACRTLGRRALVEGKPALARRFNQVLVHGMVPGQDDSSWVRSVAEGLLSDEITGIMLRRQLKGDLPRKAAVVSETARA